MFGPTRLWFEDSDAEVSFGNFQLKKLETAISSPSADFGCGEDQEMSNYEPE